MLVWVFSWSKIWHILKEKDLFKREDTAIVIN
jgi:hypothetical protein